MDLLDKSKTPVSISVNDEEDYKTAHRPPTCKVLLLKGFQKKKRSFESGRRNAGGNTLLNQAEWTRGLGGGQKSVK